MVAVVAPDRIETASRILDRQGVAHTRIGTVVAGDGVRTSGTLG